MANVLPAEKKLRVMVALVEGNAELAIERMTDVNARTIARLAVKLGEGAQRLHDRIVRDLSCSLLELDEVYSYIGKKQARVTERDPPEAGEAYTFVALDKTSRLVIAYAVGKRDQTTTDAFIADLRARLLVMPAMTSDGFQPYITAIAESFGRGVDYGQVIKNYRGGDQREDHRYEPSREQSFLVKRAVFGLPDMGRATTAHAERNHGTMRHKIGRMRRLVYAFSKKIEHHRAAVALNYAWYNFACVVKGLRMSPAMAAGITDHIWEPEEFMDAVLAEPAAEKPRAQPLAIPKPEGTARELPGGRGWLRLVTPATAPSSAPPPSPESPTPAPMAAPEASEPAPPGVAPRSTRITSSAAAEPCQLDLFAWRPKPSPAGQLSLFSEPPVHD